METTTAKTEGITAMQASDFIYEAFKGVGMVGGYLQNILADTVYYAGKYVAYVRSVCLGDKVAPDEGDRPEGKMTILSLLKGETVIVEADQREFYLNFGRDMADMTKSALENENLTIIDLSKYKL